MKNECKDELFEKVLGAVVRVTDCNSDAILSRCRHKDLADARKMLVAILYNYGYSISQIARLLLLKNHTSARYLLQSHKLALFYKKYEYYYNIIKKELEL
jgi:chromosomal replication initiation ATPase DnaA